MVKVSVIVPVYNVEKYLRRCLDSIMKQTYTDFEVICVNDCSQDNSQEILEEYQNKYPDKIRLCINEKNLGLGRSRERGIAISKGDYLLFIDSDDFVKTDYIATYMNEMEEHPCDIVVAGHIKATEEKERVYNVSDSDWSIVTYAIACTKLFRKSFITDNHLEFTDIRCGEDIYFSLSLFYHDVKYRVLDYAGYYYWFNQNSITGSMSWEKKHECFIANIFERYLENYNLSKISIEKQYIIEYAYISNMLNALITFGHGCGLKNMKDKYNFFINDLKQKFPNYKKNPYLRPFRAKGQSKKISVAVEVFLLFNRMYLDKVLFYIVSLV